MPKITPINQSFSAGEVSPLLGARSDTKGYQAGLSEMTNLYPDSRGPAVSRPGTAYVTQFTANDGRIWAFSVSDAQFYIALFGHLELFIQLVGDPPVAFVTPYSDLDIHDLYFVQEPSGRSIYVLHEKYPPYKLTFDYNTELFTFEEVVFTDPPVEWVTGNYPSAGDFFEGRLWLGGTITEPQTFWGSRSGLPEDFTLGTEADDAVEFTMAKYGRIRWIVGFKNLLIGTQNGEHIVASEGGFIQPSDILVNQQSAYGSAHVQPQQVGDQVFYISADSRKLRAIQYEWQADNWLSKDLTFNSEHITESGIKQISWQQNPDNLLHCVLNNGQVAVLTYERSNNIYGWSRVKIGGEGRVFDLTYASVYGTDLMMHLIQYRDGKINFEWQTVEGTVRYMDSWIFGKLEVDGVTVTGLQHLEGKTVQVLADDAVIPDQVVVGGKITLPTVHDLSTEIVVGLQCIRRMVTMPLDKGSPSGSAETWMKRWNKIYVSVLDSIKPLINGERAPVRHPITPMDTPEPPYSEEILKINLGHSRQAVITVEQDLPYNLIVLSTFGEINQSIT